MFSFIFLYRILEHVYLWKTGIVFQKYFHKDRKLEFLFKTIFSKLENIKQIFCFLKLYKTLENVLKLFSLEKIWMMFFKKNTFSFFFFNLSPHFEHPMKNIFLSFCFYFTFLFVWCFIHTHQPHSPHLPLIFPTAFCYCDDKHNWPLFLPFSSLPLQ